MAQVSITDLPAKTAAGSQYIAVEDNSSTGKTTIDAAVAASSTAAAAVLRQGSLPSGSVGDVFENGVFALSSSNSYTGLPTGVSVGTLLALKPQQNSNYYAVHLLVTPSGAAYVQIHTTSWSDWKAL